jgi:hypothetical protein
LSVAFFNGPAVILASQVGKCLGKRSQRLPVSFLNAVALLLLLLLVDQIGELRKLFLYVFQESPEVVIRIQPFAACRISEMSALWKCESFPSEPGSP